MRIPYIRCLTGLRMAPSPVASVCLGSFHSRGKKHENIGSETACTQRATLGGTRPPAQARDGSSPGTRCHQVEMEAGGPATTERFPETPEHSPEIPNVTQGKKAHWSIIWTSLRCLRLKTRELGTLGSREQRACKAPGSTNFSWSLRL